MAKAKRCVVLIIRDGWGINPEKKYNAVAHADTPHVSSYLASYPHTILECSGLAVGVPQGNQGSSEVGHLNMGAGRVVKQEIVRIDEAVADGSLFVTPCFKRLMENCRTKGSVLHVMGLVQDQGVHAMQDHLWAVLKHASKLGLRRVYVHFFADGRDTPPRSALTYLHLLNAKMKEYGVGRIGTLMGRYYAMDRGKNWALTDQAYNALTRGEGKRVADAETAIREAYRDERTPDGGEMGDEYIHPTVLADFPGIQSGDSVLHLNYRQDRAIQLTQAFVEDRYPGKRAKKLDIVYCGLTKYYDEFKDYVIEPIEESKEMRHLVGEAVSEAGMRQLRIAETQKFKHVTSFFNGKRIAPFPGEDQVEIKGQFDPATFGLHPEMNARDVAAEVVRRVGTGAYDLIVVNFANGDMVGHTGNFEAAVKAISVVDECVGRVVDAALAGGGVCLVTSDHGNAEEMADPKTGEPKTAHTTHPVDCIYIAADAAGVRLIPRGKLADVGVTLLHLLGIPRSAEATADNLIVV